MKILTAVVAPILLGSALCAAQTAEEVLQQVREKYDAIHDLQLSFSQHTTIALSNIDQTFRGTLLLRKKNRYRIEFDGQTIVTDGETVWSYSASTNQVLIDRFKPDERTLTPERVLAGAPGDYTATLLGREETGAPGLTGLKLIPRDEQSSLKYLRLWIDPRDWLIRKVELQDLNGKETVYVVSDIKVNAGIEESRFTYEIPRGAEVVDLR